MTALRKARARWWPRERPEGPPAVKRCADCNGRYCADRACVCTDPRADFDAGALADRLLSLGVIGE